MGRNGIPQANKTKIKRILTWSDTDPVKRLFILNSKPNLQKYKDSIELSYITPWIKNLLIKEIITFDNSDDSANVSFEQDLINVIIKKVALKKLEGKSKTYCRTGHKMEEVYTNELMHET